MLNSRRLRVGLVRVVTCAIIGGVPACSLRGADPDPPEPGVAPAPGAPAAPQTLDDLPRGGPTDLPYVVGQTLFVGGGKVVLESRPVTAVRADSGSVILRTRSGEILRVHERSLRVETLTNGSAGPPVVDRNGNFVAWQDIGPGRAEVVLHLLGRPRVQSMDRQVFPATPSCCDNPFQLHGISDGDLFASLPAEGRSWVWHVYEGQEGIPNDIPDSGAYVNRVRGLTGGEISEAVEDTIVVAYSASLGYGVVRDGRYREIERLPAVLLDVGDPRDRRIVYWTRDGRGHVVHRSGDAVELRLPTTLEVDNVTWEDDHHFLVDAVDPALQQRALVRCDARSGECEVAALVRMDALIAHQ